MSDKQRLIRKLDREIRSVQMLTPQTDRARKTIAEFLSEKRAELKALREEQIKLHKVAGVWSRRQSDL